METSIENTNKPHSSKTTIGIIILIIGTVLLVDQFNLVFIPDWIFSWPMWLIVIGLYTGAKHNFTNRGWLIMVVIGIGFLLENTGVLAAGVIWPIGIIAVGIWMIFRHGKPVNAGYPGDQNKLS
jgi:hypothetical protein